MTPMPVPTPASSAAVAPVGRSPGGGASCEPCRAMVLVCIGSFAPHKRRMPGLNVAQRSEHRQDAKTTGNLRNRTRGRVWRAALGRRNGGGAGRRSGDWGDVPRGE
ncbi:hypothetical protein San01_56120 [Streptomyces angustmyceticus]|uniref:Uncharacterized protein n=1 Tax=Streptomyces angustmyceticus TaxID=285578 RepID=A0A5J4LKS9_9ACTN|nr:hypothetical protein San01_56120 [Streptomyces angustmyceticus]